MARALVLAALLLGACGTRSHAPPPVSDSAGRVPEFARVPYAPFSRDAIVAIALREWRLFGSPVDDDPPNSHPPAIPKPERVEGLWQRVGEYWWTGMNPDEPAARWTGMHDGHGEQFPPENDEAFAWSAAFVSYVMRIAGAGLRFPYAAAHHVYIDAAYDVALGRAGWNITAERPEAYAPQSGDLICLSRTSRPMRFTDLPAGNFPAHCDIVVVTEPGTLSVVGGNVDDAVTLKHVPITSEGRLADADGTVWDRRYPWFVVLRILDDARARSLVSSLASTASQPREHEAGP